jgi:F0F1-type ATP synthase delta subunit
MQAISLSPGLYATVRDLKEKMQMHHDVEVSATAKISETEKKHILSALKDKKELQGVWW